MVTLPSWCLPMSEPRTDANPQDHVWSAEGSLSRSKAETVLAMPCELTLDEAVAKADAFLVRFYVGDSLH
jgi:hypothetical protein